MDERQSTRASSSSTSVIGNNYYVFLSFRGPDTRNGFVDHLYYRLRDVGLPFHPNFVLRDDNDLPFGEDIGKNLINAIKHSKVSIPIISEKYAASEWCLRELIQIMKCVERGEQKVLPVLYKVKPYEVRELQGAFGEAFKSRMDGFKEDVKQQGPEALRKAVASRIFESEKFASGREGALINELIEIITRGQQHDFPPSLPGDLVGIDDRVAEVMKLLDATSPEIQTTAIYGIGGIGKTTLATSIYKKLSDKFEYRSFLRDIRETINRKGMEQIQSQLMSDITKSSARTVPDSNTGITQIRKSCENKKVLLLLDDVDHRNHLDKLIGGCNFGLESRIIITCRDKALLKSEYKRYELKEMNHNCSLLLFNKYAFEGEQPSSELQALSSDIVATTGGVPLSLEIIGSFLKGKHENIWMETLEKLKKVPNKDVQKTLRISYDSLEYEEQQMFLDIACFFIGIHRRIAIYLWEDLLWCKDSGLDRLIKLSFIKFDDDNELRMHDHLRDLGRAIACLADKRPWKCSRLRDAGAITAQRGKMERLKVLNLSRCSDLKSTPDLSAFENLEMLILESCENLEEIDSSIGKLEHLISLNLRYCGILEVLPEQLGKLKELEELVIDETDIQEIPECIGSLVKLKTLSAVGCRKLTQVPISLCHLVNLSTLNLKTCKKLQELPDSFQALGKLQCLSLEYCRELGRIPPSIGKLGELVELDLSHTVIDKLPESMGELKKLEFLRISHSKIKKLPRAIGELKSLQELHASGCPELEGQIPREISGLSSLITLCLGGAKISGLPENFRELSSLENLDLLGCVQFQSLPEPPSCLSSLQLTCRSHELRSLSHLMQLKELTLHSCTSLLSIPELPSCIQKLRVRKCPKLERLSNLPDLKSLSELELFQCYGLKELDGLEALTSLRKLNLSTTTDLSNLDNFEDLESVSSSDSRSFDFKKTDNLHVIVGLENLRSLEVLNISGRKHIERLNLSNSEHMRQLIVKDCPSLVEIHIPERFDWDGCQPQITRVFSAGPVI